MAGGSEHGSSWWSKAAWPRFGLGFTAVLAIVSLAAPAVSVGDPAPETVSGSGTVASTQFDVSISAGPYGQNPTGHLHLNGYYQFDATPTCLNQSGDSGASGYRIDTGPYAGEGFLTAAGPAGAPTSAGPSPGGSAPGAGGTSAGGSDGLQILYSGILRTPPTACPPPGTPPPPFVLSGGGGPISGTLTRSGGPPNPLPLQQLRFPTPTPSATPAGIAQEVHGTMWFVESASNRLASLPDSESGQITEYPVPTAAAGLGSIAPDLSADCSSTTCNDAGMWFTESAADRIGHVSPAGVIVEYPVPTANARPASISPDEFRPGAWFTEPGANAVGFIDEGGHVSEYSLRTSEADPVAITADLGDTNAPSRGAWFVEKGSNMIGHVDASGNIVDYAVPTADAGLSAIAGSDGATAGAWFVETTANKLGHIDPQGTITEHSIPTAASGAAGLAVGAGPTGETGGAWFGEPSSGQIGYIDPSGHISEFTLPGAQAGQIAVADTLAAAPLTGYTTSEAVWWTDSAAGQVGLARFPITSFPAVCACGGVGPAVPPRSTVAISIPRHITVRHGAITATLRCLGPSSCRGRLELRGIKRSAPALASSRFTLGSLARRTLRLRLSRAALRSIQGHKHGVTARVMVQAADALVPAPRRVTLIGGPSSPT